MRWQGRGRAGVGQATSWAPAEQSLPQSRRCRRRRAGLRFCGYYVYWTAAVVSQRHAIVASRNGNRGKTDSTMGQQRRHPPSPIASQISRLTSDFMTPMECE